MSVGMQQMPTNDTATNIQLLTQRSLQREGTTASNYIDFNQSMKKGYQTLIMKEDKNMDEILNEDLIRRPYQSILECFDNAKIVPNKHHHNRTHFRNHSKSPAPQNHGIRET